MLTAGIPQMASSMARRWIVRSSSDVALNSSAPVSMLIMESLTKRRYAR